MGDSQTVSSSGVAGDGDANPASGYSLVNEVEMAKGCPMVVSGEGSVEVAECFEM